MTTATKYNPDEIPATVTQKLYIRYGIGHYNEGEVFISEHQSEGDCFGGVTLSEVEVTLNIPEQNANGIKSKVLKMLEEEKAKVLAENHQKLKTVQDKIDNLLAIEFKGSAA